MEKRIKHMKKFLNVSLLLVFFTSCNSDWSYKGHSGPQNWGELKEENKFCKIGYNQSPINIKNTADFEFRDNELKFFYSETGVEKEQKDYVQNINFDGNNYALRGKKKYNLRRMAFHHPSEHLLDSKPYSLELQIAHKSDDEQWMMLAIFLQVGEKNPEFDKIIKILSDKAKVAKLDLSKIVKAGDLTFFYDGSFTTPPCREGVKWFVMKTPLQISKEQMNQIIKLGIFAKTNARPIQEYHPEKF
jgi:carbonic anhydrase